MSEQRGTANERIGQQAVDLAEARKQRNELLDALREVMEQVGGFLPRRLERKAQAAIELGERRT